MKRLAPLLATVGLVATSLPLLTAPQAAAAPTPAHMRQKPDWHRCSPDQPAAYECATLKVPLDYQHPEGRMLDLAISRIKSENPGKRRGVLLFNPGGPGTPALHRPLALDAQMPKDVRDQYDLIGFDPRGVGRSSPITCGPLSREEEGVGGAYRPETFASDVAWARAIADKCREKSGDVIPYITTRNTARDLDVIRAALGERKISYLGYSYGTYLGAVYSQMFPQRADRFVLDSGVDPQRIWRGMIQVWATEAEPAFARWTRWAAERSEHYGLGATPEEVSATFWRLVERADRDPIVDNGQKYTGDDLRADPSLFFSPYGASAAIRYLKSLAETGRPPAGGEAQALNPLRTGPRAGGANASAAPGAWAPGPAEASDAEGGATPVYWSVVCGDTDSWPRDPEQYARDAARDKVKYPVYGDFASNIKPCAFWQRPVEAPTPMKTRADVLTVQNEWDPITPLASGQGLHKALRGSRMVLALNGEKHGVYLSDPASCADATVNAYLGTGRLPAADVTCQDPPRFP
ncbi:pimeloyl-ACP methyl ester carboxylesterase [Streptomyces sp. 2132.2]|uniref:alpha/beta hydrolase n=1 Tax=Streptomyces TaxID=1883 RepID=UPI000F46B62A|nr:alpha/beta fold hydrolase [Streptomyces sp. 2132.2]ROQ99816.1 pimeloyl-ACP methyl ester carboxylesterase [Streptomyces sp. 2132.2]